MKKRPRQNGFVDPVLNLVNKSLLTYALILSAMLIGSVVQAQVEMRAALHSILCALAVPLPRVAPEFPEEWDKIVHAKVYSPRPIVLPTPKGLLNPPRVVHFTRVTEPPESITLPGGETIYGPEDCARLGLNPDDYFGVRTITDWMYLEYERFDVYIELGYYNADTTALNDLMNKIYQRYLLLEQTTGWTSEKSHGIKLKIQVSATSSGGCYGGGFNDNTKITTLRLSNPLYMDGCQYAYYENGVPQFGNSGELGDWWPFVEIPIHELTHAIEPRPIFYRYWLTEGFATYNEYNILTQYGDINQETSDYYINIGDSDYNWEGYINNDYHDTSLQSKEIQISAGYYIAGHMFSMLRNNHNLDFSDFYNLMSTNYETLDKSFALGGGIYNPTAYWTDTAIIDMFGKALGKSFTEIQAIFRYDGPSGPGWGVRHFTDLNWYADLTPEVSFSNYQPIPGENIQIVATVHNNGDTDCNNFPVRFYQDGVGLISADTISVPAHSSVEVTAPFTAPAGQYAFTVTVDEDDIKLETSDANNAATGNVTFETCCVNRVGDANMQGDYPDEVTLGDIMLLVDVKFISGDCTLLPCVTEADVNQDGGAHPNCDNHVTLGDIMMLVDFLFISGPENAVLPECM